METAPEKEKEKKVSKGIRIAARSLTQLATIQARHGFKTEIEALEHAIGFAAQPPPVSDMAMYKELTEMYAEMEKIRTELLTMKSAAAKRAFPGIHN